MIGKEEIALLQCEFTARLALGFSETSHLAGIVDPQHSTYSLNGKASLEEELIVFKFSFKDTPHRPFINIS